MISCSLPRFPALALAILTSGMFCGCKESDSAKLQSAERSSPQGRFEWNERTLVAAYKAANHTNKKWDPAVMNALEMFARWRSTLETNWDHCRVVIATNCAAAIANGCDDAMLKYLAIRFEADTKSIQEEEAYLDRLTQSVANLNASTHPAFRKLTAELFALDRLNAQYGRTSRAPGQMLLRLSKPRVDELLVKSLEDRTMPAEEIPTTELYSAANLTFERLKEDSRRYQQTYEYCEPMIFRGRTNESLVWFLKGRCNVQIGWHARGGGYANTVSEEGWKVFGERLETAREAFERSWELDPKNEKIPAEMIYVHTGLGGDRDEMEKWFARGMALNPNSFDTAYQKLFFLTPKWHGSAEDLISFGWECVESTNWGGTVPLILADAHDQLSYHLEKVERTNYFKQPEVWADIQSAYERFFKLNPDAKSWLHNYARAAYKSERWDKLNELLPKLGWTNYSAFGGEEEFQKMARLAQQHARDHLPPVDPARLEVHKLTARITAKVNRGLDAEKDFADELARVDVFAKSFPSADPELNAQLSYAKASLYLQVFEDIEKAKTLVTQIGRDYPNTKIGQSAERIVAAIEEEQTKRKARESLKAGVPFPDFDEKDLDGKPIRLADFRGKIVLVDFWATWCGPCVAELPNVLKVYQRHHGEGFEIIGISLDGDIEKLGKFVRQKDVPWPQFCDGKGWDNKMAAQCGVQAIPATYLLDREGKILATELRGDKLAQAVKEALAKK